MRRRPLTAERALESGPRVYLRRPRLDDEAEFIRLARASRRLHRTFARPPDNPSAFRAWLARADQATVQIHLLCRREDDAIAGVLNLTEIVRGPLQSANLGYYAFAPHAGQGYMREGVQLILLRAFVGLGLHRLEANVQPSNTISLRLVLASGFRCEGYAPRLVYIAGRWRDHVRFAIDLETWKRRITRSLAGEKKPPKEKPAAGRKRNKGPRPVGEEVGAAREARPPGYHPRPSREEGRGKKRGPPKGPLTRKK